MKVLNIIIMVHDPEYTWNRSNGDPMFCAYDDSDGRKLGGGCISGMGGVVLGLMFAFGYTKVIFNILDTPTELVWLTMEQLLQAAENDQQQDAYYYQK